MAHLQEYWEQRYVDGNTQWNYGDITTPIRTYIDQLTDKSTRILVPGAGHGFEVEYLHKNGFTNVHVLDFAQAPLDNLKKRVPDFPVEHLHQADFFSFEGEFDLILEQAFFCAIEPKLREAYRSKMLKLLAPGGKLVGLLFNDAFRKEGPPYGGSIEEYQPFFASHFDIEVMEIANNSIAPRAGREIFIKLVKPNNS